MDWIQVVGTLGVGSLLGVIGTQWAIGRREARTRRVAFKKEQLEEFYGPLLAIHKEIRARSELRVKLAGAIDQQHIKDMLDVGTDKIEETSNAHLPTIVASIKDESDTFKNVLMPRYREMIDVFRERMWLAEPETRTFFGQLIEYVDIWDKILARKLPHSIAAAVGHTEKNLQPFYTHLEQVSDRLRSEIS